MTKTDFGMFTDNGNIIIAGVARTAKENNFPWTWVENKLDELSSNKDLEECTDTDVRESIWHFMHGNVKQGRDGEPMRNQ
tara:strand:+ start:224 stop:463 length:240 start_codon:yes stop_codon:yes gene_type:complete